MAILTKQLKLKNLFLPAVNAQEAALVKGIKIFPVDSLVQLFRYFTGIEKIKLQKYISFAQAREKTDFAFDMAEISGQENAKRALKAGCNLILHCNGNIKEMSKLAKIVPKIDKFIQKKTSHFYNFLG